MTRYRRRWAVIAWKLPLMLLILPFAASLELANTIAWFVYCATDKVRDAFNECWQSINCRLPDHLDRTHRRGTP
jgi:hypothetical protein